MLKGKKIEFNCEKDLPLTPISFASMEWNRTGAWRNWRPVINYEKCINCMICWKYCPEPAIKIENDKPVIDYYYCKGCLVCSEECPKNAIEVVREE